MQAWLDAGPNCAGNCSRAPTASQSYHSASLPAAAAHNGGYQQGNDSHDHGWQQPGMFRAFHVLNAPLTVPQRSDDDGGGGPSGSSELRRRRGRSVPTLSSP